MQMQVAAPKSGSQRSTERSLWRRVKKNPVSITTINVKGRQHNGAAGGTRDTAALRQAVADRVATAAAAAADATFLAAFHFPAHRQGKIWRKLDND